MTKCFPGLVELDLLEKLVLFFSYLLIFFKFVSLFIVCMNVSSACMHVLYVSAWCPQGSEESVRRPGPGVMDGCELLCGLWEPDLGLLQGHELLPSADSSL